MSDILLACFSGFSIGVLGSFHCIGMCGPLALSLPIHYLSSIKKSIAIFLYNIGRAFSYASMGVIFGLLGKSFSLFNLQQWLSIGAGLILLLFLLINQFGNNKLGFLSKFTHTIQAKLSTYLKSEKTIPSYFSIGFINGFLPCGLVYVAVAASIAAGSILNSSFLMFSFGLGTIPIMALTMIFGKFISANMRYKLNKITPYILMGIAVLLIIRGLNLGIPYLSPSQVNQHINCCHK